ncbi:UNVERIFIED_CONTAM: hypothetical protein Scaly_0891400 [Sesamum calycinum]|uniref:DUF4218 domain-containing protein n=1 Tax=Sesamum calycinum TaxID=2727403 RepID=A0AAW2QXH3_9LAMI
MLFWKDDKHLEFCKFCGHARYKPVKGQKPRRKRSAYATLRYLPITPRLQRLYASNTTAEYMSWHATHETENGVMCHPSDAEAWKYFDDTHPDFAIEPRNVRLGLCADGFAPNGQYGKSYSCWPVIITPYNLPPGMCMKPKYMFLSLIIPGPANPKRLIDVYLQPLIEELVQLWQVGHPYRRNKRAFTKGRVEKNEAPPRSNGEEVWHSVRYFKSAIEDPVSYPPGYGIEHKWTKRSIFWDLPSTNMIRHNLDVMHIEKNVFDNIFNTVMNIKGKTKDNLNARKDVEIICDRPEIAISGDRLGKMTKAVYTLDRDQKRKILEWIKVLRFPDGYTSNLGRCIDLNELKLHGMKSHDCHVFMERLIPTAFREMLSEFVWNALTEVSLLFQAISSATLDINKVKELEESVAIIVCNLEKIFPPAFFDSMEHLLVHLPYEARVGGPVQYRWMYPFECVDKVNEMNVLMK